MASTDVHRHPIATFLGELVSKIRWAHAGQDADQADEAVQAIVPFAEWQYGTYALERGLDHVGWQRTARLLAMAPESANDLVEALWSVGLLLIAQLDADADCQANTLRSALHKGDRVEAYRSVTAQAHQRIAGMATNWWGVERPPATWGVHRVRLWENAVVMARARFEIEGPIDGDIEVFTSTLRHVVGCGVWPLAHDGNAAFLAPLRGPASAFARTTPDPEPIRCGSTQGHVEFLSDPLEILNIGNAFGTCLRLARRGDEEETRSLLGWATNVNVRVIAVVDADRTVWARQTLGLCRTQPVGVLFSRIYPPDCPKALQDAMGRFRSEFLDQTGLTQVTSAQHPEGVETTCVEGYNKGWLETKTECPRTELLGSPADGASRPARGGSSRAFGGQQAH